MAVALTNSSIGIPGRIRMGDIDADGFPDIIMSGVFKHNTSGAISVSTSIYKSDSCDV